MSALDEVRRRRAEAALARDYLALRPRVLARVTRALRGVGVPFSRDELEAHYNEAWHALHAKLLRGEEVRSPTRFLVEVVWRRAVDDLRHAGRERRVLGRRVGGDAVEEVAAVEGDLPSRLDDLHIVDQLLEGVRERLSERERRAFLLCYVHGLTRPEAARVMGVSPKRMEKIMDGASKKVGALLAVIRSGGWCESRRSLINAYALGLHAPDGERHRLAVEHLRGCAGCRRYVQVVRGVAALAPPFALPLKGLGLGGVVALLGRLLAGGDSEGETADGADGGPSLSVKRGSVAAAVSGAAGALGAKALVGVVLALSGGGGVVVTGAAQTPQRGALHGRPAVDRSRPAGSTPAPTSTDIRRSSGSTRDQPGGERGPRPAVR